MMVLHSFKAFSKYVCWSRMQEIVCNNSSALVFVLSSPCLWRELIEKSVQIICHHAMKIERRRKNVKINERTQWKNAPSQSGKESCARIEELHLICHSCCSWILRLALWFRVEAASATFLLAAELTCEFRFAPASNSFSEAFTKRCICLPVTTMMSQMRTWNKTWKQK